MSRIGKRPIKVTQGVEVSFKERQLSVKGPKGELELTAHPAIELKIDDENLYKFNIGKKTSIKININKVTELFKDFIYKKD